MYQHLEAACSLNTTTGSAQRIRINYNSLGDLDMHVSMGIHNVRWIARGTFATSAGVQAFDIAAGQFGNGQLSQAYPQITSKALHSRLTTCT